MPPYEVEFVDGTVITKDAADRGAAKTAAKHEQQQKTGATSKSDSRVKVKEVRDEADVAARRRQPAPVAAPPATDPRGPAFDARGREQALEADNARLRAELERVKGGQ
jgi:hypothetical protein